MRQIGFYGFGWRKTVAIFAFLPANPGKRRNDPLGTLFDSRKVPPEMALEFKDRSSAKMSGLKCRESVGFGHARTQEII